jgi:hypothetical protein
MGTRMMTLAGPSDESGARDEALPEEAHEEGAGAKRKPSDAPPEGKKARKARAAQAKARVAVANKLQYELPQVAHVIKGGKTVRLQVYGRLERHSLLLSWVAALVEDNMRGMYEDGWGWDGDAKLAELASPKARYIVASLLPVIGCHLPAAAEQGADLEHFDSCHAVGSERMTIEGSARSASQTGDRSADAPGFWARLMVKWGSRHNTETPSTSGLADALQKEAWSLQQECPAGDAPRPVGMVHYRY